MVMPVASVVQQVSPRILVFDSGLGGLSVFRAIQAALPAAQCLYVADNAVFPYGHLAEDALIARAHTVLGPHIAHYQPDVVVIACNSASTLVLPSLRAAHSIPFVGTVPAIKPAAERTQTGRVAVLATPGTVKRDYTHALIEDFAAGIDVVLVGAPRLAALVEAELSGMPVSDADLRAEIAPCFVDDDGVVGGTGRTDIVVLGCTHYPLLQHRFTRLQPWPVAWLDPAPAIARQVVAVLGEHCLVGAAGVEETAIAGSMGGHRFVMTRDQACPVSLETVLRRDFSFQSIVTG